MQQCPQCSGENAEGSAFCSYCGAQLRLRCGNCQAFNTSDSNFCGGCGQRIAQDASAHNVQQEAKAPTNIICPRCSTVNETRSTYCYQCGLPLEEEDLFKKGIHLPSLGILAVPGGFWVRLLAYLIDYALLFAIQLVIIVSLSAGLADEGASLVISAVASLVAILAPVVYYTFLVAYWKTTLGKRVLNLYVLRPDGSRVGVWRAFFRYLSYFLSSIILLIGFLMIAFRKDKRGLHDLICDTVVVKK